MKDKIFMILLGIIAVNLTYLSLNLKDIDFSQSQNDRPELDGLTEPDEDGTIYISEEEVAEMNKLPPTLGVFNFTTNRILDAIRDIEANLQSHHVQITDQIEIATNNIQSDIAFFGR